MKSLKLYGIEDLRFEQAEKPEIKKERDVLIKIKAAGICGSDLSRYKKQGPYVPGTVWGHEFSGEVVAVGAGVKKVRVGDRIAGVPTLTCQDQEDLEQECVYCKKGEYARCEKLSVVGAYVPGGFSEYIVLPEKNCVVVPEAISYETAALLEPSAVVLHGLYRTRLTAGSSVVIVGCGNIGLLAVTFAKIFGASNIIAVDISEAALRKAQEMGATHVVNPLHEEPVHQIQALTKGLGGDVVVEAAGSPITSAQVFAYAKKGGEVVFLGIPYSDIHIERYFFEKIVRSELAIWGSWNSVSAPFPGKEWTTVVDLLENKQIELSSIITHRQNMEEGPAMFERLTNSRKEEYYGKVMLFPES